MTTRPVAVRVSEGTRLKGSSARQASRTASEIWSAILSGWPSVTDSEVNKIRFFAAKCVSPCGVYQVFSRTKTGFGLWLRAGLNELHALASREPIDSKSSKQATRRLKSAQRFRP